MRRKKSVWENIYDMKISQLFSLQAPCGLFTTSTERCALLLGNQNGIHGSYNHARISVTYVPKKKIKPILQEQNLAIYTHNYLVTNISNISKCNFFYIMTFSIAHRSVSNDSFGLFLNIRIIKIVFYHI